MNFKEPVETRLKPALDLYFQVTLPESADALRQSATLALWVFPHKTNGWQTLATTSLEGRGVDVSLYGDSLSVSAWVANSSSACGARGPTAAHMVRASIPNPRQQSNTLAAYIPWAAVLERCSARAESPHAPSDRQPNPSEF
jgi:hypothetical protein